MSEKKSLLEAAQRPNRELTEDELKQIAGASQSHQSIGDTTYTQYHTYTNGSPRLDHAPSD